MGLEIHELGYTHLAVFSLNNEQSWYGYWIFRRIVMRRCGGTIGVLMQNALGKLIALRKADKKSA